MHHLLCPSSPCPPCSYPQRLRKIEMDHPLSRQQARECMPQSRNKHLLRPLHLPLIHPQRPHPSATNMGREGEGVSSTIDKRREQG